MVRQNPYYDGPKSDHFDGLRFHMPDEPPLRNLAELAWVTMLKWRRRWATITEPVVPDIPPTRVEALRLSLIGHASLLIQVAGLNLLIDPVYASVLGPVPVGPRRLRPPGIRFEDLPPIDAILITHNHYDHLDGPAVARLWRRFRPRVVAPLGNDRIIRRYDPAITVESLDWGEAVPLSDRLTVNLEPAFHWSGRGFADRRMALWGSFVLTGPTGGVLYHVGDTAWGDGSIFPRIRETYGPPDAAILPIGAYEPRWFMRAQHVNPDEAVRIMLDCGAARAFGHHWGTFRLTEELQETPLADLAAALDDHGIPGERFQPLRPGEPVELPWAGHDRAP